MPLRVVVWSTGGVGAIAVQAVARRPDLELVGVWVHSPEKVGTDAGTLTGGDELGVLTTDDVDALLALRPDCCIYAASGPEQDAAATLPALLLGDVAGKTVIDLCAAPGGKTLQLAARGAHVIAVEIDAARAERIAENLARTRLAAEIVQSDARDYQNTAPFVLVDAPCTATGTIRRHPDLPWIKGAADVTVSAGAAYEILEAGASMVAPGGTLVFAVCSLEREEGEEQIAVFLSQHPEFSRVAITTVDVFGKSEWITPDGDLRTLPFMLPGGMDGFFAARLKRSGA